MNKFLANKPDLILTNGMAYKYMPFFGTISKILLNKNAEVFKVKPGELTRWYIVNAGPRGYLSFNFASGMIRTMHYNTIVLILITTLITNQQPIQLLPMLIHYRHIKSI